MDGGNEGDGCSKSQYGMLKLQPQSPLDMVTTGGSSGGTGHFSFANPVYEPGATGGPTGPTYKVEDVVIRLRSSGSTGSYRRANSAKAWSAIKRGLLARWEVARSVWHYMLSIGLAYFVTLCLYPGIESEIVSCKFGTWMPVILMAAFNAADLMGKMIASIPYEWSRSQLLVFASARGLLVPMLVLCATPRAAPIIPGEGYPLLFSLLLGLTNGLVGSVPMIQAPSRVAEEHRELTGNIMTLSYNVGLTGGSLVAYLLDSLLGPPLVTPCRILPRFVIATRPLVNVTTTAASMLSVASTTALALLANATFVPMTSTTAIPTLLNTTLANVFNATLGSH